MGEKPDFDFGAVGWKVEPAWVFDCVYLQPSNWLSVEVDRPAARASLTGTDARSLVARELAAGNPSGKVDLRVHRTDRHGEEL